MFLMSAEKGAVYLLFGTFTSLSLQEPNPNSVFFAAHYSHVFWNLYEIIGLEGFAAKSGDIIIMMVNATRVIPLGMIYQTCLRVVH